MLVNRKVAVAVLAACGAVVASGVVQANSIGLNFTGGNGGPYPLSSGTTAGVVAQNNWNNLAGSSTTSPSSNFADSTGATVSGTSATWSGADVWGTFGSSQSNADLQLLNGYLDTNHNTGSNHTVTPATVTVSGIGYSSYEVIAYFNSDHAYNGSAPAIGDVNIGSTTYYYTAIGPVTSSDSHYPFTETTSTSSSVMTVADYAVFSGLTGSSFTLTLNPLGATGTGNNSGIAGLQIVDTTQVPEPASLGLFAAGALGLTLATRRKPSVA